MAGIKASLLIILSVKVGLTVLGEQSLSVGSGGNVTLACTAADLRDPEAVIWSRTDLDSDVLSVRPGQKNSLVRHQAYQNRAKLLDWQVKDGEASLVLDNVKPEDGGTYECRVQINDVMKLISTVSLQVPTAPPPGNQDGSRNDGEKQDGSHGPISDGAQTGIIAIVVVAAVVVTVVVVAAAAVTVVAALVAVVVVVVIKKITSSDPSPAPSGAAVAESSQQIEMHLIHQIHETKKKKTEN